jgi:hypothetical protein
MNISLTDIEYFPKLSEETACFSGILCIDNKPVARVRNHGTGGANSYNPVGQLDDYTINKNLLIQAKKWAVTLEPKIFQEYNITVANELDFIVEDLFEKWFTDTKQNVVSFNE